MSDAGGSMTRSKTAPSAKSGAHSVRPLPAALDAEDGDRRRPDVAVLVEGDRPEDSVLDPRRTELVEHRRARPVRPGDGIEQHLGRLRAVRRPVVVGREPPRARRTEGVDELLPRGRPGARWARRACDVDASAAFPASFRTSRAREKPSVASSERLGSSTARRSSSRRAAVGVHLTGEEHGIRTGAPDRLRASARSPTHARSTCANRRSRSRACGAGL